MLITYLSFYLIFIILVSILIGLLVMKLNLPKPQLVIPLIMAIILSPLIIGYFYVTYFNSIPETVVPDLTGLPLEEAFEKLEALDLKGSFAGTIFDMKFPEGSVVSQRPEGGRRVKVGRVIRLLTSSGKRKVMVPNLLGRPAVQAEAVLAAKGLLLGESEQDFVPELDPGIILTQNPLPGEEVDSGSYVNITISTTEEPEIMIKVIEEEAGEEKEEGGFRLWW
ncbi:hypothetical protein AMJ44_07230 [candidate division WOR-1 bacterium DG_54_3]|uniref:PASTA domain-containing protein n=1 Tax=candidate division WOR-1 bacterium DG_54_3 TaxID=1703775 RepID=A0A0S7XYN6_UNCSA|nr:MAG: hypothetical protein AMJ44_07230 [candidate division WOR-1 bacterium DG_54_3]